MNLTLDLLQKEGRKTIHLRQLALQTQGGFARSLPRTRTPQRDQARHRELDHGPSQRIFHTLWALFPKTPRNKAANETLTLFKDESNEY